MQHDQDSIKFCGAQYDKVKTLIYLNHEADNLAVLKAFSLLTCYSPLSTDQVTLDGPWHWLSMGVRLAIQMGLHKSATYVDHQQPGALRRVFWQLVNSDRMASSCWGRPSAFRLSDCDVPPPSPDDFPFPDIGSAIFIQAIRLGEVTSEITEINVQQRQILPDEATRLATMLCAWLRDLLGHLRLFDMHGTKLPFNQHAYELHIQYFATIAQLDMLDRPNAHWRPAIPSLVAASCMARLDKEIRRQEETTYLLRIHGFLCMVAAVPIICYQHESEEQRAAEMGELEVIYSVSQRLQTRYGGSDLMLRKLARLQQGTQRDTTQVSKGPPDMLGISRWVAGYLPDLFPFPCAFCPGMDLLQSDDISLHDRLFTLLSVSFDGLLTDTHFNLADMLLTGYRGFGGGCGTDFEGPFIGR
ncbi:hypothetical protein BJX66DRAFT_345580 [Aspergillus keveii]|uniref:Xylanolytic transcriptional activator regulatory domain-containing protein n=1 Tax=Aspergillus keveii TaxID=714993 RepID=A0ABR4FHK2_9EURO